MSARTEDAAFRRLVNAGVVITSVASVAGQLAGDFAQPKAGQATMKWHPLDRGFPRFVSSEMTECVPLIRCGMKVLAILDVSPGEPMKIVRAKPANELKGSWALFASGVLREAYATATPTRVVFVPKVENVAHAEEHLRKLPLVAAGHFNLELVELRPFVNWSMLFAQ
jgi:hypothetical protein